MRQGSNVPAMTVVPDKTYPNMWRILDRAGNLSDLGNISRVKDAATAIVTAEYDRQTRVEKPTEGPRMRYSELGGANYRPAQAGLTMPSSIAT